MCFQRGTGVIKEEITPDKESLFLEADFNYLPRKSGTTIITEPYYYSYEEDSSKSILMTTISSPLFNSANQIIGVTGIDVSLNEIVTLLNSTKPYSNSFVTLCSSTGLYLAHPNTQLLGKDIMTNPLYDKETRDNLEKSFAVKHEFKLDYMLTTNNQKYIVHCIPISLGTNQSYF